MAPRHALRRRQRSRTCAAATTAGPAWPPSWPLVPLVPPALFAAECRRDHWSDHRLVLRRQQRHPHRPRSPDGGHGEYARPPPWRRLGTLGLAGLILTGLGTAVVLAQFSWGSSSVVLSASASPFAVACRPPGAVPCRGLFGNRTAADRGTRPSLRSVHPRRRRPHMAIRSHVAIQPHRDRRLRPGPDLARLATPKRAPGRHQPGDGTGHLAAAASRTRVAGPHRAWAGPPESPQVDHQEHPPGHRPRRGDRDRLQAVSRSPSARPSGRLWHAATPHPTHGPSRSRPTRPPWSCPTRAWRWCRSWPSGAQVPWGKVVTQGVPVVSARRRPSRRCWDPAGRRPGQPGSGSLSCRALTLRRGGPLWTVLLVALSSTPAINRDLTEFRAIGPRR